MGFASPATDYAENRLSLDQMCNIGSPGVYLFRSGSHSLREGIKSSAILIVDFGAQPVEGSLVLCVVEGEFRLRRLRLHPVPAIEELDHPERTHPLHSDGAEEIEIRGVVTHILNNAKCKPNST